MTIRPDCGSLSKLTALRSSTRHQSRPVPPEQLRRCSRAVFRRRRPPCNYGFFAMT